MSKFGHNVGSVLKDWVTVLPLRHQGVLISSVRGCDSVNKEDPAKALKRCYRALILNTPSDKPTSFIEYLELDAVSNRMNHVIRNHDHYPVHYIMHFLHAAEIVGACHPEPSVRALWWGFYTTMCKKFHLRTETKADLDERLTANEESFGEAQ